MQNVRDYVSVKLHTSEKTLLKAISNVTFKSYTIIGEDLVQTNHFTPTITHDKPIAIGFTILELVIYKLFLVYRDGSMVSASSSTTPVGKTVSSNPGQA
jgi:hypothetical protein